MYVLFGLALGGCRPEIYVPEPKTVTSDEAEPLNLSVASLAAGGVIDTSLAQASFSLEGACNEAGATIQIRIDGVLEKSAVCDSGSWSASMDPLSLPDGIHAVEVTLTGASGKSVSTSIQLTKDATAPSVLGLNDDPTPARTKSWNWSCSEAGCTFRYVIDSNPSSVPQGAYGQTTAAELPGSTGVYYLHVQARDAVGNESDVVHVSAILDNTAPAAPSSISLINPASSPGNLASPIVEIAGVASGDLIGLYSDASCTTQKASGIATGATIQLTAADLSAGAHQFYARASDSLGNTSSCSSASVAYTYDAAAPSVTGLANDSAPTKSKSWAWGCSKNPCTFRYSMDTNALSAPASAYGGSSSASLNAVTGTYYLHVQAKDAAGNESEVVHVSAELDNTPPTVTGLVNDATYTKSKSWTWGCSEASCSYRSLVSAVAGDVPAGSYDASVSATQSSGTGTFYLHVQARDAAGNESAVAHVSALLDNQAPSQPGALSGLTVNGGNWWNSLACTALFNWNASSDAASGIARHEIALGTSAGGTDVAGWFSTGTGTSKQFCGLSLLSGGTYHVSVRAVDVAGNTSTLSQASWIADSVAPSTPGTVNDGTTNSSLSTTPTISWSASTDATSGLDRYEVALGTSAGGTQTMGWTGVGTATSTSFGSLSLVNGTTYYASVRAVDKAGNTSLAGQGDGWTASVAAVTSPAVFTFTGADQTFTVPAGVTSITVKTWGSGAWGGGDDGGTWDGGGGGYAGANLSVTPGETLLIRVGGTTGWPNGGPVEFSDFAASWGAGGGSTAILRNGTVLIEAGAGSGRGDGGGGILTCSPAGNLQATGEGQGGGYCLRPIWGSGSSYVPAGGTEAAAVGPTPGNAADPDRAGAGQGEATDGRVIIRW